ncbi:MAG: RNA-binding protein [Alphaproteobacteria bacterium]|nr:RNA-binding protein [Alphaproteobacteria bacterium]
MTKPHRKTDARVTGTDRSGVADGEAPVRQCAVTRERLPQTEMVRFALSPEGVVTPDVSSRLPGRGVWVKADRETLETAIGKGAFARGFKTQVKVPDGLMDQIEALLLQRFTGLLGMAKKSGEVVLGFDQVRDALQKKRPGLLLEAADGAEDGRSKVYFLAKALYSDVEIAGALSSEELGVAFGRERVIHGLVRKGPIAKAVRLAYRRLAGFRTRPELDWFPDQDR